MERRIRPLLEELGARVLPSASPLPVAPDAANSPPYRLSGHAEGGFSARPSNPDAGASYSLSGQGRFLGLDLISVSGWVRSAGFVRHGHASGSLTLTSAKGSVTLAL